MNRSTKRKQYFGSTADFPKNFKLAISACKRGKRSPKLYNVDMLAWQFCLANIVLVVIASFLKISFLFSNLFNFTNSLCYCIRLLKPDLRSFLNFFRILFSVEKAFLILILSLILSCSIFSLTLFSNIPGLGNRELSNFISFCSSFTVADLDFSSLSSLW